MGEPLGSSALGFITLLSPCFGMGYKVCVRGCCNLHACLVFCQFSKLVYFFLFYVGFLTVSELSGLLSLIHI